jgi:PAS domain S-box-containing protein
MFVRDLNDIIKFWNRGAKELYGWPRGEAVGKISHELLRTAFPEPLQEIKAKLIRADRWEGERVHTRRDGTQVSVAGRWSIQRGTAGRPVAILETDTDVTARKVAQAKVQEQEKELQVTVDSIPTLAWQAGPDGVTRYINKQWLDYTGLSSEQALGWNWQVAVHPDDLDGLFAKREKIMTSGERGEFEARYRRFDGEYRWLLGAVRAAS